MIRVETTLSKAQITDRFRELEETDSGNEVKVIKQLEDYHLRIENGKNYYLLELGAEEKTVTAKRVWSIPTGMAAIRISFYVLALCLAVALFVRFSLDKNMIGVMVCAVAGLIPLWMTAIALAIHFIMPGKLAKIYLRKKVQEV